MEKFKRLCSFLFIVIGLMILAACGGSKSNVEAEMTATATRNKITINVTFGTNEHLKSGMAKPHIKLYQVDDDGKETYKDKDQQVTFANDVYTSASVEFTNLSFDTEYAFYLFVTFNGKDEEITSIKSKTLASGNTEENATSIATVEDFKGMANDPEGYYILSNDIDFNGIKLEALFTATSTKQFKGTFDGRGYTIKNFGLTADANTGIFGYTSSATIKNLNVSNVKADYNSGRGSTNFGVLIGNANKTVVENCTVSNVDVKIKGNSSSDFNVGGVIGVGENLSIKNVNATNINISFPERARLNISAGLFAGKIKGSSLNSENVIVENCSASGVLDLVLYYTTTAGYVYAGGFVGNVGTASLIKDSYSVADITVTKATIKDAKNNFNLGVGGFVGLNNEGSLNILGCAAIADVVVYAGEKPAENTSVDYSSNIMCEDAGKQYLEDGDRNPDYKAYNTYVGGFAGKTIDLFAKVENCAYIVKEAGIEVSAAELNSNKRKYLYVDEVIGLNTNENKVVNVFSSNDENANYSVFSAAIQEEINKYLK